MLLGTGASRPTSHADAGSHAPVSPLQSMSDGRGLLLSFGVASDLGVRDGDGSRVAVITPNFHIREQAWAGSRSACHGMSGSEWGGPLASRNDDQMCSEVRDD